MKSLLKLCAIGIVLFLSTSFVHAKTKDPVGVLFKTKGKVEYTKKGKKWRKVRRNKFLFAGYQIKTGPDGSGQITVKSTGKNFQIGPNSIVQVTKKGLDAKQGTIEATESASKLTAGLMKKFSKSQSYTTVRRSHKKKTLAIKAARELTLSDEHPYVAFNNVGEGMTYQIKVGDQTLEVAGPEDSIVRVKLNPFTGTQELHITATKDGKKVAELKPYKSKGEKKIQTVTWLAGAEKDELQSSVKGVQDEYGDAGFMIGSLYEKQNMWVAAMDQYKQYLDENPDEIEMTPYLFRVYKKLYLDDVYKKELEKWRTAMME